MRAGARLDMDAMQPFEVTVELRVATGEVCGGRQPLEIVGLERGRPIGADESGVRFLPRAPLVALAALFERIDHS
ncbi:hypothetical protein D3C83_26330 [compost metagenome]